MAPVIHFEYDASPYAWKTKLLLHAAGVDFQASIQPAVLPRKDLEALGITYRRIPLLAVGKDVYADSASMIQEILRLGNIPRSPMDKAYESWGNIVFLEVIGLIPVQALTPQFIQDRKTVFPMVERPDLATLRPSALAAFQSRLREVEEEFLGNSSGPFINGDKLSLADIHVIWPIRWGLVGLGAANEKGVGKAEFPKVWRLLESLPEVKPSVLSAEETQKAIRESEYTAKGPTSVKEGDAYGVAAGTPVTVESFDSAPGSHPQVGKLIGTDIDEFVIEVEGGVHLHLPKIGYIVRAQ